MSSKPKRPSHDDGTDDGGPGEAHRPMKYAAAPLAVLHPEARVHVASLTTGKPGAYLGSGDAMPVVIRPGALAHASWPSRVGNRLRWPDGRVTGLNGKALP